MREETREILEASTSTERAELLLALDADTLKAVKKEIVAEMGLGTKPVDPEIATLQAKIADLEKHETVQEYLTACSELKKKRGRKITPGLPKYGHDEGYEMIQVQDGTILDTREAGWGKSMGELGYSPGQIAMVNKGKRGAKDGQIFKNTIVAQVAQ